MINTTNSEQFRLSVIAEDESLLTKYKEVVLLELELAKKGHEYALKDADVAEAKRLQQLEREATRSNLYDKTL